MLEGTQLELSPKPNHYQQTKPEKKSKTKQKQLSKIKEQDTAREGIKITPVKNDNHGNPELQDTEEMEHKRRRNKVIAAIVGFLILTAIVVGVVMFVVFYVGKNNSNNVKVKSQNSIITASGALIEQKTVSVTDQKLLGAGKELIVYYSKVDNEGTNVNGRLLQSGDGQVASLDVRDPLTDITFSLTNKKAEIGVAINAIISYVLSNQPPFEIQPAAPEPNLKTSDGTPIVRSDAGDGWPADQKVTYYTIHERVQEAVSSTLKKQGAVLQTTLQSYQDGTYNESKGTFQIVNQLPLQTTNTEDQSLLPTADATTPVLFDPSNTPVLKDIYNETEIAQAAAKIVADVIKKINEVINNNKDAIETATDTEQTTVTSNDDISPEINQPSDQIKGCNRVNGQSLRCKNKIWKSGLLQVTNPDETAEVPALVIKMAI